MKPISNVFKLLFRRMRLRYANSSYERKREYLINEGAKIGRNTRMNCHVEAFGTEPYLIDVGEDCLFAAEVHFITHDGAVKVLNTLDRFNRNRMDIIAPIKIDNNVYIGTGAYIMPGVHIGSNSIIGAGAIVTKDIPSNCVAVGIPARVVESVEDYYQNVLAKKRLYHTAELDSIEKRDYFEKNRLRENYFVGE